MLGMTHRHPTTGAPGLVVMLEAAGRTIADLEAHVLDLNQALTAERSQRSDLEQLLAECRAAADTARVDPPEAPTPDNGTHDVPTAPDPQ